VLDVAAKFCREQVRRRHNHRVTPGWQRRLKWQRHWLGEGNLHHIAVERVEVEAIHSRGFRAQKMRHSLGSRDE
jgi:hypothetical protein